MKVNYRSIFKEIQAAIRKANMDNLVIENIELTRAEFDCLRGELSPLVSPYAYMDMCRYGNVEVLGVSIKKVDA